MYNHPIALKEFVKHNMPEGRLKEALRYVYHQINALLLYAEYNTSEDNNGYSLHYSFVEKAFHLEFHRGNLKGTHITFPHVPFRFVVYEPQELAGYFELAKLEENAVVIDAGAFPGGFTVAAAQMVGAGRVIALEPDPKNRRYLESVVKANGVGDKVEILGYALSDTNGQAYLKQDGLCSRICEPADRSLRNRNIVPIETRTLDSILEEQGILPCQPLTVKMDIKGTEIAALEGAKKTLERGARFIIASYHIVNGVETYEPLSEMFKGSGYEVILTNPAHLILFAERFSQ